MRRSALIAVISAAALLGGAAVFWLRSGPETPGTPARTHVLRRTAVPVTIEGPKAFLVPEGGGLYERFAGKPVDDDYRTHLWTGADPAEPREGPGLPGLTVASGPTAAHSCVEMADALAGLIEALAGSPGIDARLATRLRSALDGLEDRVTQGPSANLRALLVRSKMRMGDVEAISVGLAVFDAYDDLFDARRSIHPGGVRLMVVRHDEATSQGGAPRKMLSGVIEVSEETQSVDPETFRRTNGGWLRTARSPLVNHFLRSRAPSSGIAYADGVGVAYFGLDPQPGKVEKSAKVAAAVAAVLRAL